MPAGTFSGPVVVNKSIAIHGAGRDQTIMRGGGPVLTIGTFGEVFEPAVALTGLTLTGGETTDTPLSVAFAGAPGTWAGGGGLLMLPSADFGGPNVTLEDVAVRNNRVAPARTSGPRPDDTEWPRCPDGPCPFAGAVGGGIAGWGTLSLEHTTVRDNSAGGRASDSDGGGIYFQGSLTIRRSSIEGNRAVASPPLGRYAEGGGVFLGDDGRLVVESSSVSGNKAVLTTDFPYLLPDGTPIDTLANSGGIHVGDGASIQIDSSHIDRNQVSFDAPDGEWGVINSGLQAGVSTLTMRDSTISHNLLTANVRTTADGGPLGGAFEFDGRSTVKRSRFIGNITRVSSARGDAGVAAPLSPFGVLVDGEDASPELMADSTVARNVTVAHAPNGTATVYGAGLVVDAKLTLRRVTITGNVGIARGKNGFAQGGGIWNGSDGVFLPMEPDSQLILDRSRIFDNRLIASHGIERQGGGVYSTDPLVSSRTIIRGNVPDQCVGCELTDSSASSTQVRRLQPAVGARATLRTSPLRAALSEER